MFSWRRKIREPLGSKASPKDEVIDAKEEPKVAVEEIKKTLITQTISLKDAGATAEAIKATEAAASVPLEQVQTDRKIPPVDEKTLNIFKVKADDKEKEKEKESEPKAGDDSLANLFRQEETDENPLRGLITSLPESSANEIYDEAQEIANLLRKCQQEQGDQASSHKAPEGGPRERQT